MTETDILTERVRTLRRSVERRTGEAQAVAWNGKRVEEEIKTLTAERETLEKAAAVLSSIGEERQLTAQRQIEGLVTLGLQTIFDEDLTFHLVQGTRGKAPVVEFLVQTHLDNGQVVETPVLDARGGGLAAVVGFLLRLVVVLLSRKGRDTVLLLDETFAMLSADRLPGMAQFLRELVDRTGVQLLLVTHQPELAQAADRRYHFSLRGGVTEVREEV